MTMLPYLHCNPAGSSNTPPRVLQNGAVKCRAVGKPGTGANYSQPGLGTRVLVRTLTVPVKMAPSSLAGVQGCKRDHENCTLHNKKEGSNKPADVDQSLSLDPCTKRSPVQVPVSAHYLGCMLDPW